MAKKSLVLASALLGLSLFAMGCSSNPPTTTGTAVEPVKVDRKAFVENNCKEASIKDYSEVVNYIKRLNSQLDDDLQLSGYSLSYDENTHTVYAVSDNTTLAFLLNDDKSICFVSCTGDEALKSTISKAIADTYLGGTSNFVEVYNEAKEQEWLNKINAEYIEKSVSEFTLKDLDTSLPNTDAPIAPDINTEQYGGYPTITAVLEAKKLDDLSNYYESPSLEKFVGKDIEEKLKTKSDEPKTIGVPDVESSAEISNAK